MKKTILPLLRLLPATALLFAACATKSTQPAPTTPTAATPAKPKAGEKLKTTAPKSESLTQKTEAAPVAPSTITETTTDNLRFPGLSLLTSAETAFAPTRAVLEKNCVHCHGDNRLSTMPPIQSTRGIEHLIIGGWIVPGKPDTSRFYQVITLPDTAPGAMPPTGHAISKEDAKIIHDWIKDGARVPSKSTKLTPQGTPPRSV